MMLFSTGGNAAVGVWGEGLGGRVINRAIYAYVDMYFGAVDACVK